ncbi:MAG: hypothetical protein M1826_004193 [Phylliscum demangeonii]|nr:MAG: hypothetical protein M1826_004193 [Phylliscum demangeonii]
MAVLNLCIVAAVAFLPAWGLPHPQDNRSSSGGGSSLMPAPALHVPSALLGAGVVSVPAAIGGALLRKKVDAQRSEVKLLQQRHQFLQSFIDEALKQNQQAHEKLQAHEQLADSRNQAALLLRVLRDKEAKALAGDMSKQLSVEYKQCLEILIRGLWRSDRHNKFLPPKTVLPTAFKQDLDMRDCVLQTYLEQSILQLNQGMIETHDTWDTSVVKCVEKLHRPAADKYNWHLQVLSRDPPYQAPATAYVIQQEQQKSQTRADEPPNPALQFSKHATAQVVHAGRKWAPFAQRAFRLLEHPGADALPAELRWAGEHHL